MPPMNSMARMPIRWRPRSSVPGGRPACSSSSRSRTPVRRRSGPPPGSRCRRHLVQGGVRSPTSAKDIELSREGLSSVISRTWGRTVSMRTRAMDPASPTTGGGAIRGCGLNAGGLNAGGFNTAGLNAGG